MVQSQMDNRDILLPLQHSVNQNGYVDTNLMATIMIKLYKHTKQHRFCCLLTLANNISFCRAKYSARAVAPLRVSMLISVSQLPSVVLPSSMLKHWLNICRIPASLQNKKKFKRHLEMTTSDKWGEGQAERPSLKLEHL